MDYNHKNNYNYYNTRLSSLIYGKDDTTDKYNITELDNPNGWSFNELDMLGEMGFIAENDYELTIELEIPAITETDDLNKQFVKVYKTNEGYILETNRKYVFETFNKMLEYIDSSKSDINF